MAMGWVSSNGIGIDSVDYHCLAQWCSYPTIVIAWSNA